MSAPTMLAGAPGMCISDPDRDVWYGRCENPECRRLVIWLEDRAGRAERRFIPREPGTGLDGVPRHVDEAYAQARALLDHSPPVSASISRELLQGALREHFGAGKDSLLDGIATAVKSGRLAPDLAGKLGRLVEAGGLASRPVHDRDPSMIVGVDRDGAELTLDALRGLRGLLGHCFAGHAA